MRYSRRSWGARNRTRHPGTLDPRQVVGVALHWPAMNVPVHTVGGVKISLQGWQNYHMDTNHWSDIAYQVAIDQAGNHYRLRGMKNRSAANGNTDLNLRYGAFLLILAPGERPSVKMIAKVRKLVSKHRRRFPESKRIVGHGEIRPGGSECPGPAAQAAIDVGKFEPEARSSGWRLRRRS